METLPPDALSSVLAFLPAESAHAFAAAPISRGFRRAVGGERDVWASLCAAQPWRGGRRLGVARDGGRRAADRARAAPTTPRLPAACRGASDADLRALHGAMVQILRRHDGARGGRACGKRGTPRRARRARRPVRAAA